MMFENRNSNDLNNNDIETGSATSNNSTSSTNSNNSSSNNSSSNNNSEKVVLKGILKKSNDIEDDIRTGLMVTNLCTTLLMIVLMTPIIVCDLYFGFSRNSCINEMPYSFNFTMKLYLFVSGFMELSWLLIMICTIWIPLNHENNIISLFYLKTIRIIIGLFQIIWNILGAVMFWKIIYKGGNCNLMISTYIYVSLIIKIIINSFIIGQNSMNKN